MAVLLMNSHDPKPSGFHVIHPLDDVAEQKRSPDALGAMKMSRSVKYALFALRGYLALMGIMVAYRLLTLAAAAAHHAR